jgi:hypothetical protein
MVTKEYSHKVRDYYQIRRAAEEVGADRARRCVEQMHHGIRLIEETQELAELTSNVM